jgi:purine-nucleoside/S-methyl-5'-thioadenosine phosphorylase / adenosine deaminase
MTDPEGPIALGHGAFALFTSRAHGNLSSVAGERHEQGALARVRLREGLGVERMVRGYQVHGAVVGRVYADPAHAGAQSGLSHDEADASQPQFRADGHAVAAPGIAAMVLVADCVPVVLACRGAVAALHAGWRGLAAGVLEEGVRALADVGGEGPVRAVVGPCAGACCYEVGEEVHAALGRPAPTDDRRIDLRAIARERLLAAGVAQVDDLRACTICDERFFSHRREAARAGRQAAIAWLA